MFLQTLLSKHQRGDAPCLVRQHTVFSAAVTVKWSFVPELELNSFGAASGAVWDKVPSFHQGKPLNCLRLLYPLVFPAS